MKKLVTLNRKVRGRKIFQHERESFYTCRDYMGDECSDSRSTYTYTVEGSKKEFDSLYAAKEYIKRRLVSRSKKGGI